MTRIIIKDSAITEGRIEGLRLFLNDFFNSDFMVEIKPKRILFKDN